MSIKTGGPSDEFVITVSTLRISVDNKPNLSFAEAKGACIVSIQHVADGRGIAFKGTGGSFYDGLAGEPMATVIIESNVNYILSIRLDKLPVYQQGYFFDEKDLVHPAAFLSWYSTYASIPRSWIPVSAAPEAFVFRKGSVLYVFTSSAVLYLLNSSDGTLINSQLIADEPIVSVSSSSPLPAPDSARSLLVLLCMTAKGRIFTVTI